MGEQYGSGLQLRHLDIRPGDALLASAPGGTSDGPVPSLARLKAGDPPVGPGPGRRGRDRPRHPGRGGRHDDRAGGARESVARWRDVKGVEEVGDRTFIYVTELSATLVPRRGFDRTGEYEAVQDFAAAKVAERAEPGAADAG